MTTTQNLPTLRIDRDVALPDNDQWQLRFEIQSESSDRIYIIAQHKSKRYWGCSCPSYRVRRYCKHLTALGLPTHEKPFEVNVIKQ